MSSSYTLTESEVFTITNARHMAAKVATDLKRIQRLYGQPYDIEIADYENEVIVMLKGGYFETVSYGFRRNGNWIEPTICYVAAKLSSANDDDPGRIRPGANVANANFYSYMTYTNEWHALSESERITVKQQLPFSRGGAPEPGVDGYLQRDLTYSSGGRALERASVRSY